MTFSSPVDGFRLAYDRVGSGLPVVLLHGWPGDRTDYRDLVPLLAGSAQVIVPDLRGFGRSDKHLDEPEAAYSGAGQARSVTGLIDELGLEPAVIVGYDVGYSPPGAFTASVGWYHSSSSPDIAYVAEIAPEPAGRIDTPTTVLWQEFDAIFPREWSDRLDEFFTDVSLEMLDGVGHYTPLEAPDRLARAVKKRLAGTAFS
jgi:pimeloyl-ACP methyl ester carboxylesterase